MFMLTMHIRPLADTCDGMPMCGGGGGGGGTGMDFEENIMTEKGRSHESLSFIRHMAHAPNSEALERNRSETKIPSHPSDSSEFTLLTLSCT